MAFRELLADLFPERPGADDLVALAEKGFEEARQAAPDLVGSKRGFLRALVARLDKAPSVSDFVEVALVAACAEGDAAATARFEREHMAAGARSLSRMGLSSDERDEILQRARMKLLVAETPTDLPQIVSYAGAGRLTSFVRVVVTREALSYLRTKRGGGPDASHLDELAAPLVDPGLRALAERSQSALRRGFELGIEALSSRERNVLRLHLLDGVELGAVARLYQVHRVTASRWLADIRERLVASARNHVQRELGLRDSEVDSVVRLARQELDVSIERILRTPSVETSGAT